MPKGNLELTTSDTELVLTGKFAGKEFTLWIDVSTGEYTLTQNDLITHQGQIGENNDAEK